MTKIHDDIIALIRANEFECGNALPNLGFIATLDDEVIGYIGGYETFDHQAFISVFVVNEAARKLGVGVALIGNILQKFKDLDVRKFEAIVEKDNTEAADMFLSFGITFKEMLVLEGMTHDVIKRIEEYKQHQH